MRILPKTVLIFGLTYKVIIKKIKADTLGLCCPVKQEIALAPNQKRVPRLHTFLHEFIHAVVFRTGVFQGVDEKVIEVICENLATALLENFTLVKKKAPRKRKGHPS